MDGTTHQEKPQDPDGVRAVIDALYRDFLLRDLFAKVVPGTIVLLSAVGGLGLISPFAQGFAKIGLPAAILLAGGAWLAGFAVQSIGEDLRLIRHHPETYDQDSGRYGLRIDFKRIASPSEDRRVERYTLIKEAAGNGGTAVILACAFSLLRALVIRNLLQMPEFLIFWLTSLILAVALIRTNRSHMRKQYSYMERVLEQQGVPHEKG